MRVRTDEAWNDGLAGAVDDLDVLGSLFEGGPDAVDVALVDGDVDVWANLGSGAVDEGSVVEDDGFLLGRCCDCG